MRSLTNEQRQLVFDHSLDFTSEEETTQAEKLIANNEEAADIRSKLKTVLATLDTLPNEFCPDGLAERTVRRLAQAAKAERAVKEPAVELNGTSQIIVHAAPQYRTQSCGPIQVRTMHKSIPGAGADTMTATYGKTVEAGKSAQLF